MSGRQSKKLSRDRDNVAKKFPPKKKKKRIQERNKFKIAQKEAHANNFNE